MDREMSGYCNGLKRPDRRLPPVFQPSMEWEVNGKGEVRRGRCSQEVLPIRHDR